MNGRISRKNIANLFSLAGIQGANALLPIAIFPYLYSVLDVHEFSVIVTSEVVAMYALVVSLYSFDVTALKDMLLEDDAYLAGDNHGNVYWSTLIARLIILLLFVSLTVVGTSFFAPTYVMPIVYWMMFPLGMVLQSNYYFQALEDNFRFSCIIVFSRVLACILVYVFVDGPGEGMLAICIIAGGVLFSGIASLYIVALKVPFKSNYINPSEIFNTMKSGFSIFVGNVSVSMFRGSNILILSLVSNTTAVSLYSLAEKIVKSVQALSRPMNQLAYPKIVNEIDGRGGYYVVMSVWKHTRYQVFAMAIILPIVAGILYLAIKFFDVLNINVLTLVGIMSSAALVGILNYMFGTIGLSLLNKSHYYAKAVFVTGIISLIITVLLSLCFDDTGAAISFAFSEALLFYFFYRNYSVILRSPAS